MAVNYWTSAASGDWNANANWSEADVPEDGDEVIFDSRSVVSVTEGMLDGESGAALAGDWDLLHIKEGYTGTIGSATEPLCGTPTKVIMEGTGTLHLLCGETDQSTDATIPTVIINNPSATVYLYSNCNDGANIAEFTNVYLLAGTLYLAFYDPDTDDQGCSVANLYVMPRDNKSNNATVYIKKDAYDVKNSTAMNIYMANGTLTTDSQVGTFHIYNGTVNYGTDLGGSPEADLDIATLIMHGGTFNWYPDDSGTPTITAAWLLGKSKFYANATTNDDRAKTITALYTFAGTTIDLSNSKGNITVTSWYDYGSSLTVDTHGKLALTYDQP
jgi:hypothetical protein